METYTFLRQFADSWALLAMTIFFLVVVLRLFLPGARAHQEEAARIPLRNEQPRSEARSASKPEGEE